MCIYIVCICSVCMYVYVLCTCVHIHVSWCMWEGKRTTFGNQFSPSHMGSGDWTQIVQCAVQAILSKESPCWPNSLHCFAVSSRADGQETLWDLFYINIDPKYGAAFL